MSFIITKPLEEQKQEFIAIVNSLAGDKINSLYPDYTQRNMLASFSELIVTNTTKSAEGLAISSAWDWIKSVRDLSNVANSAITTSTTVAEIKQIVDTFTTSLLSM